MLPHFDDCPVRIGDRTLRLSELSRIERTTDVETKTVTVTTTLTHYDKALGEQGNKMFTMSRTFDGRNISNFLSCGDDPFRGPNADYNRITASLVTRTRPLSSNRTAVETTFTGYFTNGRTMGSSVTNGTKPFPTASDNRVAEKDPAVLATSSWRYVCG